MADLPLWTGGGRGRTYGPVLATTTLGASPVSGADTNKGAWLELVAATPEAWSGLSLEPGYGGTWNTHVYDVGVGPAGAEQVIASDILIETRGPWSQRLFLPIGVPAGARVAARVALNNGWSNTGRVAIVGVPHHPLSPAPYARATGYGTTAARQGTIVTPGTTAHVKSAWVQIVASTTRAIRLLAISACGAVTDNDAWHLFDVAVGPSGAEQVVLENISLMRGSWVDTPNQFFGPVPIQVPAGSRIAVRSQSSRTDAGRSIYVSIIGID